MGRNLVQELFFSYFWREIIGGWWKCILIFRRKISKNFFSRLSKRQSSVCFRTCKFGFRKKVKKSHRIVKTALYESRKQIEVFCFESIKGFFRVRFRTKLLPTCDEIYPIGLSKLIPTCPEEQSQANLFSKETFKITSDVEEIFFGLLAKYLRQGCQKWIVRVQRNIWRKICFRKYQKWFNCFSTFDFKHSSDFKRFLWLSDRNCIIGVWVIFRGKSFFSEKLSFKNISGFWLENSTTCS